MQRANVNFKLMALALMGLSWLGAPWTAMGA
jgi:hypothetical protein